MYCYFNVLGPKKTLEESFNSTNGIWHETEIKSTANQHMTKLKKWKMSFQFKISLTWLLDYWSVLLISLYAIQRICFIMCIVCFKLKNSYIDIASKYVFTS